METNKETAQILDYVMDALISHDNYGEPMSAGIADAICQQVIVDMMHDNPGIYEFLWDSIDSVDFAYIANLVNQTK